MKVENELLKEKGFDYIKGRLEGLITEMGG